MPISFFRSMTADPSTIAERLVIKAKFRDGLLEIYLGLTFVLCAAVEALPYAKRAIFPQGSTALDVAFIVISIVLCSLFVVYTVRSKGAAKWVRERYLIERSGYVEQKLNKRKLLRYFLVAFAAFLPLAIAALFLFPAHSDRGLSTATGLMFCGLDAWIAWFGRVFRFAIYSVLSAASAIFLAVTSIDIAAPLSIFFAFLGLVMVFSGFIVLLLFIRRPAEREA